MDRTKWELGSGPRGLRTFLEARGNPGRDKPQRALVQNTNLLDVPGELRPSVIMANVELDVHIHPVGAYFLIRLTAYLHEQVSSRTGEQV